jgi:hypothetical protein
MDLDEGVSTVWPTPWLATWPRVLSTASRAAGTPTRPLEAPSSESWPMSSTG